MDLRAALPVLVGVLKLHLAVGVRGVVQHVHDVRGIGGLERSVDRVRQMVRVDPVVLQQV
jgi:hypothetical protein